MGILSIILFIVVLIIIVIIFLPKIMQIFQISKSILSNGSEPNLNFSTNTNSLANQTISEGPLVNYTLSLINKDRNENGFSNVSLSSEPSAQQHADSMLEYNYFSHWDIYGMKPYMRYTLLNGKGAVEENVAYTKSGVRACLGSICSTYGNLNVTAAIAQMEYNMVYNDSLCCNNGHRFNILDPYHNQVSIGIAYNSTTVYLVEDFVNNYIYWLNNTPSFNGNEVQLKGSIANNYVLSSIEVTYDPIVSNMSIEQLDQTHSYSYGNAIAGISSSPLNYYPNLTTIDADNYYTSGSDFLVGFNMEKLIQQYGSGEYTIAIWLDNSSANSSFIGSTYTIFINSNGNAYVPSNI